jgi:hypothetical protein
MRSAIALPLAALLTAGTLLLPGCGRFRSAPAAPVDGPTVLVAAPPAWTPIPASALLYYDNGGGIQDSVRILVRDPEALATVWARATSTQSAPPALPAIDFAREMVVVAGAGRMTPDDLIRVDSVGIREEITPSNERRRVMEVIVHTERGCGGFATDAYPLVIARVQRFDGEVRFTERRSRGQACPAASATPLRSGHGRPS